MELPSTTNDSITKSKAIGPDDVVTVKGRYLVKEKDGSRFMMKGIAFPVPVDAKKYNEKGWISVLHQLSNDLELDYNTIRLYRMYPRVDYSGFFEEAARLGIYVIVPLTAASGGGVLDREVAAPKCYHWRLFHYGKSALHNYMQYPNILAGVIGNEVINQLEAWPVAPCVKAYGRDLKKYMAAQESKFDRPPLPLMYAAQNSAFGANMDVNEGLKVTQEYLACQREGSTVDDISGIDIFGVNVESWCSSKDTFEKSERGFAGPYHSLWKAMRNTTAMPLVMSEMGCAHMDYNRENELRTKNGTRDWIQVPVVLREMADTWSGFSAYAYNGNLQFNMFENHNGGGVWDGIRPMEPTADFFNFQLQLKIAAELSTPSLGELNVASPSARSCQVMERELKDRYKVDLHSSEKMYVYGRHTDGAIAMIALAVVVVLGGIAVHVYRRRTKLQSYMESSALSPSEQSNTAFADTKYGSISTEEA
jgi:hypothetical protein